MKLETFRFKQAKAYLAINRSALRKSKIEGKEGVRVRARSLESRDLNFGGEGVG